MACDCCGKEKCNNIVICPPIIPAPGVNGRPGSVWHKGEYGALGPASGLGVDGDFAIDSINGRMYNKDIGAWNLFIYLAIKDSEGRLPVGTTTPNSSSILDAESTTKGMLVPRMTTAEKNLISPVVGLLVFDVTLSKFSYYNGASWDEISTSPITNTNFAENDLTLDGDRAHDFDSNDMVWSNVDTFSVNGVKDPVAILKLSSTTKGIMLPMMSSIQRGAIAAVEGLIVYDNDDKDLFIFNGTVWKEVTTAISRNIYNINGELTGNREIDGLKASYTKWIDLRSWGVLVDDGGGKTNDNSSTADANSTTFTGGVTYSTATYQESEEGLAISFQNATPVTDTHKMVSLTSSATAGNSKFEVDSTGSILSGTVTATKNASAYMDLQSTTRGFLPPRNSDPTANIPTPALGLMAYNTTTNEMETYTPTGFNGLSLKLSSGEISSADVLTLNSLPIEIISSVAGKVIIPLHVNVTLLFSTATVSYATNTILQIQTIGAIGVTKEPMFEFDCLGYAFGSSPNFSMPAFSAVVSGSQGQYVGNNAVEITVKTGDPTAGDGVIRYQIVYYELPI